MFIDQVDVAIKAGDGGDGAVAFRREKYVAFGGPAGGDGGRGGNIIFTVDEGMLTLMNFRYNRRYRAKNGENGMTKNMHGKGADDLILKVPAGTIIRNLQTGAVIADLVKEGDEVIVAKGGRGGRGNSRFATAKNPAPELSENGEPGAELQIQLELKLLADVGVIGFPSVGKSTFLSIVTAAKPKIGAYPFTTITPNIGVVSVDNERSFVLADMPGLIAGAHTGIGLGTVFLRHIERTKVLVHMVDMSGADGRDPYEDYLSINHELEAYDNDLSNKMQIIIANKMDIACAKANLELFLPKIAPNVEVVPLSTVELKQAELQLLLYKIYDMLVAAREKEMQANHEKASNNNDHVTYKFTAAEPAFKLSRDVDGVWLLTGAKIEKLFKMTNFAHEESIRKFARQLRNMGVDEELRKRGGHHGDTVRLLNTEFEWQDQSE